MDLQPDTSTLGTVVGIVFVVIALVGTGFLGWEWGGRLAEQPIAVVVGVVAAVIAVVVTIGRLRE